MGEEESGCEVEAEAVWHAPHCSASRVDGGGEDGLFYRECCIPFRISMQLWYELQPFWIMLFKVMHMKCDHDEV